MDKIHFVTHSLGGILVRQYLQRKALPEGSRLVMVAPPNQGTEVADFIKKLVGSRRTFCPAGLEFMAITADGHVLPCNFAQYSLGRIGQRPLARMRADLMGSPWFRGRHACCLLGEDREFFERYVAPYRDQPKPLDAYAVFGLGEDSDDTGV